MATYKKQLHDKDGNVIYPDVGLNLDDVVYSDDPTEPAGSVNPWIDTGDILDNAVTSDKVNLSVLTSTSSSITLTAGVWLVIHKCSVGQIDISDSMVLIYNLTNFPNQTTIAGKCDVQNLWQTACEATVMALNSDATISRSNSTASNAGVRDESWTAVRIK